MYGELGSVKGVVDLSPQQALDEADVSLASLGYTILQRAATTLTVERRSPDHTGGQAAPNLTVAVLPQPEGGVQIKLRGNDREGMRARQAEWMEWSESLPKKPEVESDTPTAEQGGVDSPEVDLPPPPAVESPNLPAPAPAADVPAPPPHPHRYGATASKAGIYCVAWNEASLWWLRRSPCAACHWLRRVSCSFWRFRRGWRRRW